MTDEPKAPPLRLLEFSRKDEDTELPIIPGKQYVASLHVISSLESALEKAKAGHFAATVVVAVATDGSELFFVAGNKTTYSDLLGAIELVKKTIVDAALKDFTVKPRGE